MAKKGFLLGILAMALTFGLALTGCPIEEYDDGANAAVPDGFGTVRVSVSLGAARTAMPTPALTDFARVEYWFAKGDAAAVQKTAVNDVFTMEEGNYTLTVKAYVADTDESLAAEGTSSSFTVAVGTPATVTVTMRPIVSEGNGSLSFSISYPVTATVETFTLTQLAGDNPITLTGTPTTVSGTTTLSGSNAALASGYYILQITLTKADNTSASTQEAVHIYQNLNTAFSYTFADAEFIPVPVLTLITTVAELTAYLETLPTGSAATPSTVPLALAFNTGTVQAGQIAWAAINTAVQNSGKYVTLDLSASTAANDTTANTIAGALSPSGNNFNIIQSNTYIKGIIVPDTLISIGDSVFRYCSGLTSVTIPGSVTSIGTAAFSGCSGLTSVIIPDSVTSIGGSAFSGCSGLISVTIPPSVTSIGQCAFYNCTGLTSVTIPGSVTTIGNQAFYNCTGLTSVTIPDSVTTIESEVFQNCSGLTSVTIPDSVTTIGRNAFLNCSSLDSVTIPGSVTTIGNQAFAGCSSLISVTIPDSVTTIEYGAFFGCSALTSVSIPDSVTSIGQRAFQSCTALTSVTIPGSVTSIENEVFSNCTALASVTILGSVTSIGQRAFQSCTALASVTIPGSPTIGEFAFAYCSGLTSVTFVPGSNITTAWDNNAFSTSISSSTYSGTNLWNAYTAGTQAGTYTRVGTTWTQTVQDIANGEGSVTLTFWVNEDDQILASNSSVTISKTSAGGYNASFTATVSGGYGTVSWSVSGVSKSDNESVAIVAADYPTGTYRLRVIARKDGVPYSTEITFTVID